MHSRGELARGHSMRRCQPAVVSAVARPRAPLPPDKLRGTQAVAVGPPPGGAFAAGYYSRSLRSPGWRPAAFDDARLQLNKFVKCTVPLSIGNAFAVRVAFGRFA